MVVCLHLGAGSSRLASTTEMGWADLAPIFVGTIGVVAIFIAIGWFAIKVRKR